MMKRVLIGLAAMTLFSGMGFAAVAVERTGTFLALETEDGTQVKVVVPKEEAHKLQNVKSGDSVKLIANPDEEAILGDRRELEEE